MGDFGGRVFILKHVDFARNLKEQKQWLHLDKKGQNVSTNPVIITKDSMNIHLL